MRNQLLCEKIRKTRNSNKSEQIIKIRKICIMRMKEKCQNDEDTIMSPTSEKILFDNRIKRKNVLALNEKVAAIREYEKMPVYKRIGRMFHCSPDQIKRIVQQKESILKSWEQRTRRCNDAKKLELKVVRVSMLGKAVYEWIQRMMYYKDLIITDGLIQKMALQFKSAMGLQNFFPHQDWCDKFRHRYKILENDSKLLDIGFSQGYSVQIKDIIKDVLSECGKSDTLDENEEESPDNENKELAENTSNNDIEKKSLKINLNISRNHANEKIESKNQSSAIRQIVTLPFQTNNVGIAQKVLVATPIQNNRTLPGTTPMTMTIIPLATISQPQNSLSTYSSDKTNMPTPILDIKEEIKNEVEEVQIKEEYVSDDENGQPYTNIESEKCFLSNTTTLNEDKSSNVFNIDHDDVLSISYLSKLKQKQIALNPAPETNTSIMTSYSKDLSTSSKSKRISSKRKNDGSMKITLPTITNCTEARQYLKLIEDFALVKENFRLIGLITRADEVLRELDDNNDD